MSRCWCQNYRARTRSTASGLAHHRGAHNPDGDCMYAATDKDANMREQVRGSFVRVSEVLTRQDLGFTIGGKTIAELCDMPYEPSVSCEHTDVPAQLVAERNLLLRMIDELLEQDIPCVDVRWYRKHVESIRRGKPVHDFR